MAVLQGAAISYAAVWCLAGIILVSEAASNVVDPVAIVGLGMGGAAAAHYMRKAYPDLDIHGFEKYVIGGRAQEIIAGDKLMELGASVIYGRNMYLVNLTLEMNLTIARTKDRKLDSKFALYDGKRFVYKESGWKVWDKIRLLHRYGMSLFVYTRFVKDVFCKFFSIYALQESGQVFHNPAEVAAAMGLMELTQKSGAQTMQEVLGGKWWLEDTGVQRFIDELPGTANRINYNQHNEDLNGFVNTVSFMPATDSDLWQVAEGNNALPRRLVSAAGVEVQQGQAVSTVRYEHGKFFLITTGGTPDSEQESGPYSSVVIATPLEAAGIAFNNITIPPLPPREYQTTVTTFLKGRLRAQYFGHDELPLLDLSVTNSASTPFTSITPHDVRQDGEVVYKIFSTTVLDDAILSKLFEPYSILTSHTWKAYPKYSSPQKFAPFVLFPGLFYNNAMESLASAMEMSIIAGVNSAMLVKQHLDAHKAASPEAAEV